MMMMLRLGRTANDFEWDCGVRRWTVD